MNGFRETGSRNSGGLGQIDEHLRVDDVVVNELGGPTPIFASVGTRAGISPKPAEPVFVLGSIPHVFLLLLVEGLAWAWMKGVLTWK